jgi:predicted nucleic acid-binding protein
LNCLLDTGPWVALIDGSESAHADTVKWFKEFRGRMYTTEAVLTEVMYLLNFSVAAQTAALDFILEPVVDLVPASIESVKTAQRLIAKYADLPMDYADATLVCLANETGIRNVATFDKRDFGIYRVGKKLFNIFPPTT